MLHLCRWLAPKAGALAVGAVIWGVMFWGAYRSFGWWGVASPFIFLGMALAVAWFAVPRIPAEAPYKPE